MRTVLMTALILFCWSGPAFSQTVASVSGDRLAGEKKYKEAMKVYRAVLDIEPYRSGVESKMKKIFTERLTNALGMEFVYIKPGSFQMGSPSYESNRDSDERQHRVTLSKGFYMQTTEVTQRQWHDVMGNNPSNFKGDSLPVESVSWNDVQEFIRKVNARGEGTYRLPTEAEWEYGCRASTTTAFHYGNSLSSSQANFDGNYPYGGASKGVYRKKTVSVGSFGPNAWGLYDMHGNVWEWCEDWYGDYSSGSVTDPRGPSRGIYRVFRGGSWIFKARDCRSADRLRYWSAHSFYYLGFRLVREVELIPPQKKLIEREAGGAILSEVFSPPVDAEYQADNNGVWSWFYFGNRGSYTIKVTKDGIVKEIEQHVLPITSEEALNMRNIIRKMYNPHLVGSKDTGNKFRDEYSDRYTSLKVQFGVESLGDDVLWILMTDISGQAKSSSKGQLGLSLDVLLNPYGDDFPDGLAGINLVHNFNPSANWILKGNNDGWKTYEGVYANKDIFRVITDENAKIVKIEYVFNSQPRSFRDSARRYLKDKYKKYFIEDYYHKEFLMVTFSEIASGSRTKSLVLSSQGECLKLVSYLSRSTARSVVGTDEPLLYITNSIDMKLRLIESGTFQMGTRMTFTGRDSEKPLHTVRISKDFYIGVYEVTQREYE